MLDQTICCCEPPHYFTVTIDRQYATIVIDALKMRLVAERLPATSCQAFICPTMSADSGCVTVNIPIGYYEGGCRWFIEMAKLFSGKAYAKTNCTYNTRPLAESGWLPIFIPAEFVASTEEKVETEQKPVVQPPIDADHYDDGIVISNDLNKHVIDDGLEFQRILIISTMTVVLGFNVEQLQPSALSKHCFTQNVVPHDKALLCTSSPPAERLSTFVPLSIELVVQNVFQLGGL
ncbi:unnamed protein product [Haemonchus placei]|uniref:Peptidase S1 domain-containing protein n=1 Tax=Haemonchus placei TaxID=6290 RepID=A0A0N4WWF4_HAEPC|nr:unnamed protein product [Haemonchus placei]